MIQRMFVTLDTKKTNYKNVGKINHGDDLILELTVLSDGDMISFNNPMVDLLVKKSDGKMIRQNSGIEHIKPNKFIIEVSKDCVTSPGLSTNQLIINDNGRISTCMFYYTILNSLEEDIIESISNVEVLEQLDEFTIQMKDKMENFDEELRNRMSELEDAIDDLTEFFGDTGADLLEAELSRNEAEQSRAQAESVRVQNENRRLQNDLDLANAEAERVRAENIRIQNEVDRALVDAVMDQKESKREDSELERIQNESKRATDEVARQQNENTRQSNESIRMSNETDRKTQENRRATAETNRVNAETTRRNNENSRISNETERQKAMNEMKSLIDDVYGFDERIRVIEDEIEETNSSLDNMKNFVTPEMFGAIGDGLHDDTKAINDCISIAKSNKLNIEFGTDRIYVISDKFVIDFSCVINGNNSLFNLESKDDEFYYLDILRAKNVVIKNMRFKSEHNQFPWIDKKNNTSTLAKGSNSYAIYIRTSENILIENIRIERCAGIGAWNTKNVTIKDYECIDGELPVFCSDVDGLLIDGYKVGMNGTGLSGFYHHIYFNGFIKNAILNNGVINYQHESVVSDCFNFLNASPSQDSGFMQDIIVTNVIAEGNICRFARVGQIKNIQFNNVYFNSQKGEMIIEHCGTSNFEDVYFKNCTFKCGNVVYGIVREALTSEADFYTEFNNCKLSLYLNGVDCIVNTRNNINFISSQIDVSGDYTQFNMIKSNSLTQKIRFKNCTVNENTKINTIIASGNFTNNSNTVLELIGNIFNVHCKGAYCFYCTGGVIINNIIENGKNVIDTSANVKANNNYILQT